MTSDAGIESPGRRQVRVRARKPMMKVGLPSRSKRSPTVITDPSGATQERRRVIRPRISETGTS
ncbi:MAG TPA: hypothetical protein VMH90_00455 [Thermoplasmata archaeon]|nr:hypothetical protein [Thermoplasmata archaeon]